MLTVRTPTAPCEARRARGRRGEGRRNRQGAGKSRASGARRDAARAESRRSTSARPDAARRAPCLNHLEDGRRLVRAGGLAGGAQARVRLSRWLGRTPRIVRGSPAAPRRMARSRSRARGSRVPSFRVRGSDPRPRRGRGHAADGPVPSSRPGLGPAATPRTARSSRPGLAVGSPRRGRGPVPAAAVPRRRSSPLNIHVAAAAAARLVSAEYSRGARGPDAEFTLEAPRNGRAAPADGLRHAGTDAGVGPTPQRRPTRGHGRVAPRVHEERNLEGPRTPRGGDRGRELLSIRPHRHLRRRHAYPRALRLLARFLSRRTHVVVWVRGTAVIGFLFVYFLRKGWGKGKATP